jgi:YebC/PmpR family DNA-binding regulatory protein
MAKHSHWSNIKHKKAANDKRRAAVISKMGKLITVAVQMGGGPNPDDNPRLRLALEKARHAGMALEPVERAIKKAAGLGGEGKQMEEVTYEGYAKGGVAVVVTGLTDNRTRTAPEIKKLFEYAGGAMGVPGCVSWQFKDKAVFLADKTTEDAVMEALLAGNADAEDIDPQDDGQVSISAAPNQYDAVVKALAAAKIGVASQGFTKLPDNGIPVTDLAVAKLIQELIDSLDEHDDIQDIYHNGEFAPEVAAQLG